MPSTAPAARPVFDENALRQRLAALRRRLRRTAIVRAVSWLALFTAVLAVAAGALDAAVALPSLARAGVLVAWLVGAGLLTWFFFFRPLARRCDDLSLALRIEQRFPTLNDALASTVQFLEAPAAAGDSASLRREAVKRALDKAKGCDFNRIVDSRGLHSAAGLAVLATAGAVVLALFFPAAALSALVRLVDPFNNRDLPPQTVLELDAPRERIGRNEAFEVHGRVRGVVPPKALIAVRIEGFPAMEYPIDVKPDGAKKGTLALRLEPGKVQRTFHFQVRANDAVSKEYEVQVLPPPVLTSLGKLPSPQLQFSFPRYTGLPSPQTQTPGVGNIDAPAGTFVVLRAAADRKLGAAWIEYLPEPKSLTPAAYLEPLGAYDLTSLLSLSAASNAVWGRTDAELDEDRRSFTIRFLPWVSGVYALHFEDETGLGNNRLFDLRLRDDPAPTVQFDRPSKTRDVLNVLPNAELPLQVTAEDPLYGLRSVFLEYRLQLDRPPQRLLLHDAESAVSTVLAPLMGPAVAGAAPRLRPTRLEFRRTLALASLRRPDGGSLRAGDVVSLQACADDWDEGSPFKEPGRSSAIEIRIIDRDEFDLTLNQEQADVQQKLLRLREKEREAQRHTEEAEHRLRRVEKIQPKEDDQSADAKKQREEIEKLQKEIDDELRQAQQLQKEIQEGVGDNKEGVRAQAARVLESLRANDMRTSPARDRMERVQRELERLADNELRQIDPRLTAALKEAELLDPKNKEQRKALKEEQARDLERQAREMEQDAQARSAAADRAERRAEDSTNAAEKARLRDESAAGRKEADDHRRKASALRKEAARERDDANEKTPAAAPRQAVAQAREMQEEVEKTLTDLLTQMEPWSSSREVKGEAGRILQEQRKLQARAEELEKKLPRGQETGELTSAQQAELAELADSQRRLEERTNQLLGKMNRMADERAAKDPEGARDLKNAHDKAAEGNLDGHMKNAGKNLDKNQLSEARGEQKAAADELQKMVKGFEERREDDLDRLAKKLAEKQKELEALGKDQDELQKQIEAAEKANDEQELARLGKKQKALAQKAKDLAEQLTRMGADRAGRSAAQAGEAMDQAGARLEKGQKPEDEDAALDRLAEARDEVDQAKEDAEDQLSREQQARIAEEVQRLKERQEGLNEEAVRIRDELKANKERSRKLLVSMSGLSDAQRGLGDETEALAHKDLAGAPVFLRLMMRSAESMADAAARLDTGRRPDGAGVEDEVMRAQQEALHRLDLVLNALKSDDAGLSRPGGKGGQGGQGGQGGDAGGQADSVPPVAQLKVLRTMQKEVNDRTAALQKDHPDPSKYGDKEKGELQDIRKEQQDVMDLLEEFRHPPEPAAEGDKK
jgi:hypothetical protein